MLVLASPLLMPDRRTEQVEDDLRDFSLPRVVAPGGPLVGRTVTEAGLRNLEGTFLVHLSRAGEVVAPVGPQEVLQAGDQLTFVGNLARAVDLQAMPGLLAADTAAQIEGGRFFEAVLSPGSAMVGQTPKEVDFRARFDSAIVAVHRAGERVTGKLGQIRLRGGDVLLLLSGPDAAVAAARGLPGGGSRRGRGAGAAGQQPAGPAGAAGISRRRDQRSGRRGARLAGRGGRGDRVYGSSRRRRPGRRWTSTCW